MAKKTTVIGSGFGGLAAALRLKAKGHKVTLVEKHPDLGGRARVFKKDEFDLSLDQKEAFFKDRASDNQIQKIWKAPSKIELSKYIKLNRQPPSLLFQNFKFSDSTREKNLFLWQFLKKIIQPISVSIFVLLALIFCQAFLRDYSITYKVLTGVVLTIFFNFTEKIAGNVSIVFGFSPLITTFIFLLGLVSGLVFAKTATAGADE